MAIRFKKKTKENVDKENLTIAIDVKDVSNLV